MSACAAIRPCWNCRYRSGNGFVASRQSALARERHLGPRSDPLNFGPVTPLSLWTPLWGSVLPATSLFPCPSSGVAPRSFAIARQYPTQYMVREADPISLAQNLGSMARALFDTQAATRRCSVAPPGRLLARRWLRRWPGPRGSASPSRSSSSSPLRSPCRGSSFRSRVSA